MKKKTKVKSGTKKRKVVSKKIGRVRGKTVKRKVHHKAVAKKVVKGGVHKAVAKKVVKGGVHKAVAKKVVKRGKTAVVKKGITLESYTLKSEKTVDMKVEIKRVGTNLTYNLQIPEVYPATEALLEDVRDELITGNIVGMTEIVDPKAINNIRKKFRAEADAILMKKIPTIPNDTKALLVNKLMHDMLGLGEIEFLVGDGNLEEIVIPSSKEPIRVYHKKYGWLLTNFSVKREDEIINYSNIIARRVGRQITVLKPLLDAHLLSGDRVNAVLYPVSTKGNTITIRRFSRDPYTIIDLIKNKTCDLEIAALLWIAIEYEMNVIISGGTASGKTVLLNACMPFIPPNHRIISVEDTRELVLPEFLYWTPLVTRSPNPEGKGAVTMLDLLVNSLRMRPDRIVLGEMRRKEEAMVLFEAMHTGHSVYATMHANSATETINRLINPPLSVPANLLNAVNLNFIMFRDRKKGIRRIYQVAEFNEKGNRTDANILYRWIPEMDKMIKHSESSKFFEDIGKNTGMTRAEVQKNLEEKRTILEWLLKNKIRSLDEMGGIMNYYYTNKEFLLKNIRQNNVKMFKKEKKVEVGETVEDEKKEGEETVEEEKDERVKLKKIDRKKKKENKKVKKKLKKIDRKKKKENKKVKKKLKKIDRKKKGKA